MKECPTCQRRFSDEDKYCLADGTPLVASLQIDAFAPGQVLSRHYRLERRIGSGPTGVVFEVIDQNVGGRRAIKIFNPALVARQPDFKPRFEKSAARAAAMHHPNIVSIYDFDVVDDRVPFVVMEFVSGRTLAEILEAEGAMSPARALELITPIADGISAAHDAGVIHGGLTPRKVIVTDASEKKIRLKITGVGLSALPFVSENPAQRSPFDSTYAAPESALVDQLEARSDVYSLGAILCRMLALDQPVGNEASTRNPQLSDLEIPAFIRRQSGLHSHDVPAKLVAAVEHAMEPDIARRTSSVEEFLKEIELASTNFRSSIPEREPQATMAFSPEPPQTSTAAPTASPAESKPIYLDDNVQFTVYRPKRIKPAQWYTMLAFAHLSEPRPESNEPDPIAQMREEVSRVLGASVSEYSQATEDSSQPIPQMGEITFIPSIDGVEFNPRSQSFFWEESVHGEKFRMRASAALDGQTARGRMSIFLGSILLSEINLRVEINSASAVDDEHTQREAEAPARPYRNIFPSYDHDDTEIVAQIEQYAQLTGDKYLRDVRELRSGQNWKVWMKQTIDQADIFQLFWSNKSMRSENVTLEWKYALTLNRPNFIRPTYWETPFPESAAERLPPAELKDLYFYPVRVTASPSAAASEIRPPRVETSAEEDWGGKTETKELARPEAEGTLVEESRRRAEEERAREAAENEARLKELAVTYSPTDVVPQPTPTVPPASDSGNPTFNVERDFEAYPSAGGFRPSSPLSSADEVTAGGDKKMGCSMSPGLMIGFIFLGLVGLVVFVGLVALFLFLMLRR